jgi:predicted tellurium resistance membrane protein TerC
MITLLFILMVTGSSILISCHFALKVTWFTYYIGTVIGILVSGMALDFWNKRNRRDVDAAEIRRYI